MFEEYVSRLIYMRLNIARHFARLFCRIQESFLNAIPRQAICQPIDQQLLYPYSLDRILVHYDPLNVRQPHLKIV